MRLRCIRASIGIRKATCRFAHSDIVSKIHHERCDSRDTLKPLPSALPVAQSPATILLGMVNAAQRAEDHLLHELSALIMREHPMVSSVTRVDPLREHF